MKEKFKSLNTQEKILVVICLAGLVAFIIGLISMGIMSIINKVNGTDNSDPFIVNIIFWVGLIVFVVFYNITRMILRIKRTG